MDLYKYSIEDAGTFSSFASTMENAGAMVDRSTVMFKGDNGPARMLAESLVEYGILSPLMEAGGKKATHAAGAETSAAKAAPAAAVGQNEQGGQQKRAEQNVQGVTGSTGEQKVAVQERNNLKNSNDAAGAGRQKFALKKAVDNVIGIAAKYINDEYGLKTDELKAKVNELVKNAINLDVKNNAGKTVIGIANDSGRIKGFVNREVSKNKEINSLVENEKKQLSDENAERDNENDAVTLAEKWLNKLGVEDERVKDALVSKYRDRETRARATGNARKVFTDLVNVLHEFPDVLDDVKNSGAFAKIGIEVTDDGLIRKTENGSKTTIKSVVIPEAFTTEPDESEWENAVITSFGFPMVNLSSQLVRDMLRATDPKQQKRSYRELTKQMKKQPAIANALGMGVLGTLGLRNSGQKSKSTTVKLDSVNGSANPVMEGPVTMAKDIISGRASMTPVEILKLVANQKGTPCKRNPLYVRAEELEGKGDDDNVKVVPIGNGLKKKNQELEVPLKHLTTFYTVIDPKQSFGTYVKAYAELAMKNKNIKFFSGLRSESAKEKQVKAGMADAEKHLKEYVDENGAMPFYLLKARSQPKEIDRWSDEDALHGYQLVIMNVDGHKAGMFLTKDTAEALFKVG